IIYDMTEALVDYPGFILQLIGRMKYGKGYEKKMKAWAPESQKRQYAGDWVATFMEGDGKAFDYGLDMTECGILKFFQAQGATEIVPYICVSMDGIFSRAFHRGLVRTMTLAEGYDKCDFRYKRGRKTLLLPLKDGWPPKFRNL
ncbi:L-2-amino-thiazoline-4-carboxylic acid hydrolase, partial [Thermodesulfobacteriota bacterium]